MGGGGGGKFPIVRNREKGREGEKGKVCGDIPILLCRDWRPHLLLWDLALIDSFSRYAWIRSCPPPFHGEIWQRLRLTGVAALLNNSSMDSGGSLGGRSSMDSGTIISKGTSNGVQVAMVDFCLAVEGLVECEMSGDLL